MPLSLSAVRAPSQSPVSVSCSQIEGGGFRFLFRARARHRESQRRGSRQKFAYYGSTVCPA